MGNAWSVITIPLLEYMLHVYIYVSIRRGATAVTPLVHD